MVATCSKYYLHLLLQFSIFLYFEDLSCATIVHASFWKKKSCYLFFAFSLIMAKIQIAMAKKNGYGLKLNCHRQNQMAIAKDQIILKHTCTKELPPHLQL